ncbi:MAG TPA: trypsin-like peptidase domain-containing protein [Kineosporiaceae bacterium]
MDRAALPLAHGALGRGSSPVLDQVPGQAAPSQEPADPAAHLPRRPRRRAMAVVVGALACALGVLWYVRGPAAGPPPLTRADVDHAVVTGIQRALQQARNAPSDAAAAYRTISPSLVTITTQPAAGSGATEAELGSGVVVNASGSVLTALHVVETEGKPNGAIQVRFADGTVATGTVAGRQPDSDIAVLAVDRLPHVVVPAVMGGGVQVGDSVFPVGSPFGLTGTLTAGVVSALDREVRTPGGAALKGLIQFDAAVNPGNSGGPLLNRDGQVIGIVTGLANPSGQKYFVGIGFAVPIATAGGAAGMPQR